MPKQPGENYDAYLVVDDPSQQTSRRHFEFGVTSIGQVWAMDLGSANGTFVLSNGTYIQLPEKKRTVLADNDVIRFGGLSAKVERRTDRG
ncbi:FHA domain-containing protein [Bifidobacterium sp. B4001]|nr:MULTISPECIES: FHA domain-containing protein [unclassified Bifidobacterium]MCX8681175.1 FHA domain-containing protein [Bifidobacterium sp. B4001]